MDILGGHVSRVLFHTLINKDSAVMPMNSHISMTDLHLEFDGGSQHEWHSDHHCYTWFCENTIGHQLDDRMAMIPVCHTGVWTANGNAE
jgi:hypothetical protein